MAPPQLPALLLLLGAGIPAIPGILGNPGIPGVPGVPGMAAAPAPGRNHGEIPAPSRRLPRSVAASPWLRWAPFRGSVPADAVSSPDPASGRAAFVCSTRAHGCNLGSFEPARGPFCLPPGTSRSWRSADFRLLLNPGGFEALDWVDDSFGGTPPGAVEGCPLTDVFVGRGPEGLGKVSKEQQALFVPVRGEEVWYKWYQVLAVRQGAAGVSIADVSYDGGAALESAEDAELAEVLARNEGCEAVSKEVAVEEATEVERGWSAALPALAAARGVLRAPPIVLTDPRGWDLGNVTAVPWVGGAAVTEFVSRVHRARPEIPARSECSVLLRGLRRRIRVPFGARLTREFRSGPPHRVDVAGTAWSGGVTGVRVELGRCRSIAGLPPCPGGG
ncbi:LOW QUALITY PROTEIN: natterin-3-like [Melozone crissalis]|uniref:LOW QUALITY PROTEIN: natterin-3-like n=1 Tax=Melozone crissalis TaxID=40204 RepID=UPI0023DA8422|nr:LOW QUALITY PROTEIN: natterin-3-like [Melozone crissalis]